MNSNVVERYQRAVEASSLPSPKVVEKTIEIQAGLVDTCRKIFEEKGEAKTHMISFTGKKWTPPIVSSVPVELPTADRELSLAPVEVSVVDYEFDTFSDDFIKLGLFEKVEEKNSLQSAFEKTLEQGRAFFAETDRLGRKHLGDTAMNVVENRFVQVGVGMALSFGGLGYLVQAGTAVRIAKDLSEGNKEGLALGVLQIAAERICGGDLLDLTASSSYIASVITASKVALETLFQPVLNEVRAPMIQALTYVPELPVIHALTYVPELVTPAVQEVAESSFKEYLSLGFFDVAQVGAFAIGFASVFAARVRLF